MLTNDNVPKQEKHPKSIQEVTEDVPKQEEHPKPLEEMTENVPKQEEHPKSFEEVTEDVPKQEEHHTRPNIRARPKPSVKEEIDFSEDGAEAQHAKPPKPSQRRRPRDRGAISSSRSRSPLVLMTENVPKQEEHPKSLQEVTEDVPKSLQEVTEEHVVKKK